VGAHAGGKHSIELNLRREWPDQFHTGRSENLRDDDHPELELALGDKFGHDVRIRYRNFRLDGVGDSKPIHQLWYSADSEIADRFGTEQRSLERLDGTDVRLGRAGTNFNANPGTDQIGTSIAHDLTVFHHPLHVRHQTVNDIS